MPSHAPLRPADVLVIGAGPAGCACARAAARAGLDVLLLEARDEALAGGPQCVVDVEGTVFAQLGLAAPTAEERVHPVEATTVYSADGTALFHWSDGRGLRPLWRDVLVRRLQQAARTAGARWLSGHRAVAPRLDEDRCTGAFVRDGAGHLTELAATMVVDASGHDSALLRRLPGSCGLDFSDRASDRVLAETLLVRAGRSELARAAARLGQRPEELRLTMGIQGPYSTELSLISPSAGLAVALVGVKAASAGPSPGARLSAWRDRLGCAGETVRGGAPIRIRRASLRLVADGFATCGEAAGMVIPMHGSGVANSLRAGDALGRHLGEVLGGPAGPTTAALWPWAADYQRGVGAILASYDVNRRAVERLDAVDGVETMLRGGLLHADDMLATFTIEPLRLAPASLPARALGVLSHPLLVSPVLAAGPRLAAAEAHWRRYPRRWEPTAFARWRRVAGWLLP